MQLMHSMLRNAEARRPLSSPHYTETTMVFVVATAHVQATPALLSPPWRRAALVT